MPVDCHDTNSSPAGRFTQMAVKRSGTVRSWPPDVTSYTAVPVKAAADDPTEAEGRRDPHPATDRITHRGADSDHLARGVQPRDRRACIVEHPQLAVDGARNGRGNRGPRRSCGRADRRALVQE